MMTDEKIKNSSELEFVVFCIENVAAKLGVDAERVYQAFTEQSDICLLYTSGADHLNPVWLHPVLENAIRSNGDTAILPAFNCFS